MVAGLAVTANEIDDACGHPCGLCGFGDDIGFERGLGGRLHDNRAARGERISHFVEHDPIRPIPRGNGRDHADGFIGDEAYSSADGGALFDERELLGHRDNVVERHR